MITWLRIRGGIYSINNGSGQATGLTIPDDTNSQHDTRCVGRAITDTTSAVEIISTNNRPNGNDIIMSIKVTIDTSCSNNIKLHYFCC